MCARFTLGQETTAIARRFGLGGGLPALAPRYNQAPGQQAAVIRGGEQRSLSLLRWGLVPHWARDPKIGYKLINARAETAPEKPSFRAAFAARRCLVPADGFYEWQKAGRAKQPLRFVLKDRGLFAMAGLWEQWRQGENRLATFTILTTGPNSLIAPVHDRMPVILQPEMEDAWLAQGPLSPEDGRAILAPFPARAMEAYPVSPRVNSPKNEGPELIEPLVRQESLF